MKVLPISPRGYCPGVVRALDLVRKVLANPSYPRPIYLLGMIVHNHFVVESFQKQGILCLEDTGRTRMDLLEGIEFGTVVITAHGVGDEVIAKCVEKGLTLIDATCKDVYRIHNFIKNHTALGHEILYVGKAGHPETEGILSLDPKIRLIQSVQDVLNLPEFRDPVFVTNQTTFSIQEIEPILQAIRIRVPQAEIAEEICNSTRIRQEAVLTQNHGVDLCLVVGDARSNNTANLVRLSREATGVRTARIDSAADLTPELLWGVQVVSVTSGASTPTEITAEVLRRLENWE